MEMKIIRNGKGDSLKRANLESLAQKKSLEIAQYIFRENNSLENF